MKKFEREDRYIVLKLRDIGDALSPLQRDQLGEICAKIGSYRQFTERYPLECVVVESDWACYEDAWKLVEQEWQEKQ